MIIVRCSKTQNGRFPSKIALRLKKVCYKVSLREICQQQSCKAFIGLTIPANMIVEGRSILPEILGQTDRVEAKSLRSIFARCASTVRNT